MKLVIAIVSNKDVKKILDILAESDFRATKVSTSGQLLEGGHSCFFIGTEDNRVESLLSILKENVTKRVIKSHGVSSTLAGTLLKQPVDVEEYGGVAFVVDVEDFEKF